MPKMRAILIITFALTTHVLRGQESRLNFGFNVSIVQRSNQLSLNHDSQFDKVHNLNRWGFDLGLNFYYEVNDRFEIRVAPTMGFEEDEIAYTRFGTTQDLLFGPIFVKLPAHSIVEISDRVPLGIITGITPCIQISQSEDAPLDKIKLKKYDLTVDVGLNYPIEFPWFVLYPEVRYSKSLINSAGDDRTEYGQAISGFYRDRFVFGLYFRERLE